MGEPLNLNIPADGDPKDYESVIVEVEGSLAKSDALSMVNTFKTPLKRIR